MLAALLQGVVMTIRGEQKTVKGAVLWPIPWLHTAWEVLRLE